MISCNYTHKTVQSTFEQSTNIDDQKNQILNIIKEKFNYDKEKKFDFVNGSDIKEVDGKLYEILTNNPLGSLGCEFINCINTLFFEKVQAWKAYKTVEIWKIYSTLDRYITDGSSEKIMEILPKQLSTMREDSNNYGNSIDKGLIKNVYLSENKELINIFKQYLPIPSFALFDSNNTPSILLQAEEEKTKILAEFIAQNDNDPDLEKKIMLIQRHIRGNLRKESEIERINKLHFEGLSKEDALEAIEDANTPYRPKKCSQELADRIMKASEQVELYTTVKHLAATKNLQSILDTCLSGRKNLINSLTKFRGAALFPNDIKNGDFNVICFGPDKIDTKCLRDRTVGLVFDLKLILDENHYNKNPAIFFKQKDFGYSPEQKYSVPLGNSDLIFSITRALRCSDLTMLSINLQFFNTNGQVAYHSELPKYSFISYNLACMQQVLTLNFFRFIDTLKNSNCYVAKHKTAQIYEEISKLSESELVEFLTAVGKGISSTSEFNFYGAYKTDLKALKTIEFYKNHYKEFSLDIDHLIEQLNCGSEEKLNELFELAPELFKSEKFTQYLISKLNDKSQIARFL